jgi:hypothetical protein
MMQVNIRNGRVTNTDPIKGRSELPLISQMLIQGMMSRHHFETMPRHRSGG